MKLIIGLGNPGEEYKKTRHNLGFMVLDEMTSEFSLEKKLEAEITREGSAMFAKPTTFMNESGRAVSKICQYYKIDPSDVWVVHDDKDMELGKIKVKPQGGSGGHNGIKSIIQHLGTEEFNRVKLGIAKKNIKDTSKFVLNRFSLLERAKVKKMLGEAVETIKDELIREK